jgi:hypothetical protein
MIAKRERRLGHRIQTKRLTEKSSPELMGFRGAYERRYF